MKRFTKITLMASAIAAMAGAACLIVCLFLGFTWSDLTTLASDFHMPGMFRHIISWNVQTDSGSDPVDLLSSRVSVGNDTAPDPDDTDNYDNMENYTKKCKKLDLEIGMGNLIVTTGNVEYIQVDCSGNSEVKQKLDGDTLKIKSSISSGDISVTIPAHTVLDQVRLSLGAGEARMTGINTLEFDAEVGAGSLDASLAGKENNYNYSIQCGIGEVNLGKNTYSGIGHEQTVKNPGAGRQIDIECGAGSVSIRFQE